MTTITIDLETTANGGLKGTSPEAHYRENKVLLYGWKVNNGAVLTSDEGTVLFKTIEDAIASGKTPTIVGHNLKFDLKYLIRERPDIAWHKVRYYCTMFGEYRQSGHNHRFTSLEETAKLHGIKFKKGLDLGALIKSGIKMENIPMSDLRPYLEGDVDVTEAIHRAHHNHPNYVDYTHQHILPLAHMELLGLPLNVPKARTQMEGLVKQEYTERLKLLTWVQERLEWSDGEEIEAKDLNYSSARTVSYLLTGEPKAGLTNKVRRNIVWKAGAHPILSNAEIQRVWKGATPGHLGYPMAKMQMEDLYELRNPECSAYLDTLKQWRHVSKLISTYYGPFLEQAKIQPTIHPKMNMCTTATGRLSSSAPNGQNMPPEVRNLFTSEYGKFMEIDFKQLEVVALAYLSGDAQLIADIRAGEDIHFNTGRHVMGWKTPADMKKKERTLVKNVNFGLIYGGAARGLSLQTGQPETLIKKLIKSFYKRYPQVAVWQKQFYHDMVALLKPAGMQNGEQIYDALIKCPTSGRKFYFKEGVAPAWMRKQSGRKYSFKPTESKNYPVQGFAGGDIVMMALWVLYTKLCGEERTRIRMTVHDSILVDTDMSEKKLAHIMDDVCEEVETYWNLPFNLGFDIEAGTVWQ